MLRVGLGNLGVTTDTGRISHIFRRRAARSDPAAREAEQVDSILSVKSAMKEKSPPMSPPRSGPRRGAEVFVFEPSKVGTPM